MSMGYKGVITGHFSGNKIKKEIILSIFDTIIPNTGYIANQWDTKLISGENGVNNADILQLTL